MHVLYTHILHSLSCVQQCLVQVFCDLSLSYFQKGQIKEAHLAEAFVILTAQFFSVLRTTVFRIMIACIEHGKASLMKNNSGQKN